VSRFDNVGLWWEDFPKVKTEKNERAIRFVEPPKTGWTPPREFPNLYGAKVIGLDTETKDLQLLDRGPGAVRGAAHVVGVSVATEDRAWYFPVRHEYEREKDLNLDPDKVFGWLGDLLGNLPAIPVVGANLLYDLECLRAEGISGAAGELFDIQLAEPLLDETARSYSLEALARKYLDRGKETSGLYEWSAATFGGKADGEQRKNIWRSPPSLVGPYAEADALLPLQILAKQRPLLKDEELTNLFRLECALIPLLLDMRFRGVRIDLEKAEQVAKWLRAQAAEAQEQLKGIDVWSGDSLAAAFRREGLEHPLTEAGNPSFTRLFLESLNHPLAQNVLKVRTYEKAANPFVESYSLGDHHRGRVHCQFHPLRSDEYGTVSGRFSSSNPNLQNIPSRDKVLGPLLRSLFIPEEGCKWKRADYSQIEYRMLAHYAVGPGSDEIRARYHRDPTTDYHASTVDIVQGQTGITLERKPAKNLNFGLVYGMGRDKVVRSLDLSEDLGNRLYDAYFEAMPFVKRTYKSAERLAKRRGYIKTILGRRRRFGPDDSTHKALNACLQGSAADVIKKAMAECYAAGVFDCTGIPHLTVHDELDWSDDGSKEAQEAFAEAERIMASCVPVRVPLLVDMSSGAHWGDCL
jgi:DNA polymerase I-like protein with 3'-5' exonuclease and polymerase domains